MTTFAEDLEELQRSIANLQNRVSRDPGLRGPDNQPISQAQASQIVNETRSGNSTILTGPSGTQTAVPGQVEFNPEEFFISAQDALTFANEVGEANIDQFLENFDLSRGIALENLETEITGLESFLPRSSSLIRQADAETNELLLSDSDRFDLRNDRAARRATEGNVGVRQDLFDQNFPGLFDRVSSAGERNQRRLDEAEIENNAIIERNRAFAEGRLPDELLDDQLSRSARNSAADRAAAGGFGVSSAASRNFLDRVDLDTRLGLVERGERNIGTALDRARAIAAGSQDIVSNEAATSQNLFRTAIEPGIVDFQPIQATPVVTNIGGQISPTPTTDAGSIQRAVASDLTDRSTISPTTAFQGSLTEQRTNADIGITALGFEQSGLNAEAAGINNIFDLEESRRREEIENERFQAGLDLRESSQELSAITQLGSTAANLLLGTEFGQNILRQIPGIGNILGPSTSTGGGTQIGGIGGVGGGGIGDIVPNSFVAPSGEGLVIPQGQAVPQGFEAVGSSALPDGSAGTLVTPVTQTGFQSFAQTVLGATGPVNPLQVAGGVSAGIQTGIQQFNGVKNFLEGKDLSPIEQAALFLPTFGFSLLSNEVDLEGIGNFLGVGSGKNEDQKVRDAIRESYRDRNITRLVDGSDVITLADGSTYDVGVDGSNQLPNSNGANLDGRKERFTFDADFSNPLTPQTIGFTNPLSIVLAGDLRGQAFAGHLTNAVQSNAPNNLGTIRANAQTIALADGADYGVGIQRLQDLRNRGQLSDDLYQAYANGWYDLWFGN